VRVDAVWRYPVKSMLGEQLPEVEVTAQGLVGDRRYALVDRRTGSVASAKQPRLWRALLGLTAQHVDGDVVVRLPGGPVLSLDDPSAGERLSTHLGRQVVVSSTPGSEPEVDRAEPDEVLAHGVEAAVPSPSFVLGAEVPGPSFLDLAPLHLVSTATLEHLGQPAARYRPNLVVRTPPGTPPYTETAWVGSTLVVGDVVLRVVLPTPRCAVPVLAHGSLPPDPRALRQLVAEHAVDVPGHGVLPVAGVYATVQRGGRIAVGTPVR
jgi:uncharacterized protein YcbX